MIYMEGVILDGGGGDFGDGTEDGGGVPGTPTGSSQGVALPFGENGGVLGTTWFLFVPTQDSYSRRCYIATYDIGSFDDDVDASRYSYRAEDILKNRVPTVNRVILNYRDLGPAKLTVTITGTNDNGEVVSNSVETKLGNTIPTGAILTKFVDIQLTAFRPQLSLLRKAGGGPVCITGATMRGEVEDT